MRARPANSRRCVEVALLGRNILAARYLQSLLEPTYEVTMLAGEGPLPNHRNMAVAPSVLIIDEVSLPEIQGRYLSFLRAAFPNGALLVLGRSLNVKDLCRLLMMGIKGYVAYDAVEKDLARAIESLGKGRMWVPRGTLEQFALFVGEQTKPRQPARSAFTERENVILGLLHRRLSNKEIGSTLGIGERTVRFHLEKIFDKLGVHDRHSVADMTRPAYLSDTKGRRRPAPALAGSSTMMA